MVSPIYIIIIALGISFLLGTIGKKQVNLHYLLMIGSLAGLSFISAEWSYNIIFNGLAPLEVLTAGFKPPFSINLLMGKTEAIFTLMINFAGLFGGIYLYDLFKKQGRNTMIIFLVFIMSLNVIIMTRDIFNLFVFLEIASIATAGLIIFDRSENSLAAGFKYVIATAIIAGLLLIGIIFAYYFTGSLNLADFSSYDFNTIKGGTVAIYLILIALILELKPFPANGWGIDVYEAVNPGISAVISAATVTAGLFVLYKILAVTNNDTFYNLVAVIGIITFIASNIVGTKQEKATRLLGYSSIAQTGLLLTVIGLSKNLGTSFETIFFSLLITHYLSKAILFWIAGIVNKKFIKDWGIIRSKPLLLFFAGISIFALMGFPPFPAFFGKWELLLNLSASGKTLWVFLILIGSLIEAVYLFRWFGKMMKLETSEKIEKIEKIGLNKIVPVYTFGIILFVISYYSSLLFKNGNTLDMFYIPLLFIAGLFIIDRFLTVVVKNSILIAAMSYYSYIILPELTEYRFIFGIIFLIGGIITLLAGFSKSGKREGFYPFVALMYTGLIMLVLSENILQFFISWELMTAGSYFLILRGKNSISHALSYMLFSLGGAFLILAGFSMAFAETGAVSISLDILKDVSNNSGIIYALLAIGFMTKTASIGLHIWLPGAHAEAESDVSPMVSAILLKAGMFGLVVLMISMGDQNIGSVNLPYVLGWIGAITALLGNLMAAFQEDAKRLLAYSSIGQLGYVVFALAFMSHLGWLTALAFALNHFIFKAMLFLAIGGVVMRTKTKKMYEMGGLIKNMPFSFISVMIGIIALSGVPPLTGFAGKWLSYNAMIEKGWYFQGFVVSMAGLVAFLYCFRLIHTIFLGQPKDKFKNIKEAPFWMLFPQYILIAIVMTFSILPNVVLEPIGKWLVIYFPVNPLVWEGTRAYSFLGYWDGTMIMNVTGGIFVILFLWLLYINRKSQKVKQFNIVYSGEAPVRPELTHYAYNFFAPYNRAVGFLAMPLVTNFWNMITNTVHAISDFFRKLIYTGNGQGYIIHILLFIVSFYFWGIS